MAITTCFQNNPRVWYAVRGGRFKLHAGFAQLQFKRRLAAPGVLRDAERDAVKIDPLTRREFRQGRWQRQREVRQCFAAGT
jgi:hypothetical protein